MRTAASIVGPLAAVWCLVTGAAAAKPPDFEQATRVEGKVPVRLGGAWFLYAQAEFPGGKTRALAPALLTASQKTDADVALRILDVRMPKSIGEPYEAGNRQPKAWEPSREDIALLRQQWSKLPPATNKDWRKSEVLYDRVEFTLASPEKYAEVFAQQDPGITAALSGSVFVMQVVEKYRPQPVPAGENVAQVMERKSMYVVHSATDSLLEGQQFTAYLAAGPGVPIPMTFMGPFKLYRLAKATGAPPPGSTARGRRSAR